MNINEKIMKLRKEHGWSQEELAYRLDVSRQAVSKWESGASLPEIDKIIMLSKVFNVSTDELLKNNNDYQNDRIENVKVVPEVEINQFLEYSYKRSTFYSFAAALLIFSPSIFIVMIGLMENKIVSQKLAFTIGISTLFVLILVALVIFTAFELNKNMFKHIEVEKLFIKEENKKELILKESGYNKTYNLGVLIGTLLCCLSLLPLLVAVLMEFKAYVLMYATSASLVLIALGLLFSVRVLLVKQAYDMLLQRGKYNKGNSIEKKFNFVFDIIYWSAVIITFLTSSLITGSWSYTWMIWMPTWIIYICVKESRRKKCSL